MRVLAAGYLTLQGIAGVVWWVWLFAAPTAGDLFFPADAPETVRRAFLLPDLLLFVGASFVTARLAALSSAKADRWGWLTIGAVGYGALYCIALASLGSGPWLAALSMAAALAGTVGAVRYVAAR